MDFANKVQRRRALQERRQQAIMISKRVDVSPLKSGCGDDVENMLEHNNIRPTINESSSSSWWSDLMARKKEAEKKGFLSIASCNV